VSLCAQDGGRRHLLRPRGPCAAVSAAAVSEQRER